MNLNKASRRLREKKAGLPSVALQREGETRPASPLPENSPTQGTAPLRIRAERAAQLGLATVGGFLIAGAVEQLGADAFEFLIRWLGDIF